MHIFPLFQSNLPLLPDERYGGQGRAAEWEQKEKGVDGVKGNKTIWNGNGAGEAQTLEMVLLIIVFVFLVGGKEKEGLVFLTAALFIRFGQFLQ